MNNNRPILKLNIAASNNASITKSKVAEEETISANKSSTAATEKGKTPTSSTKEINPIKPAENKAPKQNRQQQKTNPEDKPKLLLTPEIYNSMLDFFKDTYPNCFTNPPTPLAINIHKRIYELHKDRFSRVSLKKFLTIYCRSQSYRQAHIVGAGRLDLSGDIVSSVTEEQVLRKKWKKAAKAEKPTLANNDDININGSL